MQIICCGILCHSCHLSVTFTSTSSNSNCLFSIPGKCGSSVCAVKSTACCAFRKTFHTLYCDWVKETCQMLLLLRDAGKKKQNLAHPHRNPFLGLLGSNCELISPSPFSHSDDSLSSKSLKVVHTRH